MSAFDDRANQLPPQPSGGGCGKIIVILLAVAGFGTLLLCCGGGGFLYWGYKQFNFTMNPAKVREIANGMLDVTIPEGYTPAMGMDMKQFNLAMAMFADEKQNRGIVLVKHPPGADINTQDNAVKEAKGDRDFTVEKTEEKTFKLNGEDFKFVVQEGKDKNGKTMRQFMGDLDGKSGKVALMFFGNQENVTEEEFQKLLDTVKTTAISKPDSEVKAPPVEPEPESELEPEKSEKEPNGSEEEETSGKPDSTP